jgi:hypothetical protein
MSQRLITELTCDRCDLTDLVPAERWAKLRIKPLGNLAEAYLAPIDLCPDCFRAYERFMKDGQKGKLDQGRPPYLGAETLTG